MLKDNIDYNYVVEQIDKEINIQLELQDETMESQKMNNSLQAIENSLNTLYEKTRYLEDMINYTKTFIKIKIDNYYNSINSSIKLIEDISTINKNLGYIDYNVPFIENNIDIADRNKNYKITPCCIKNNKLTMSNRIKETYDYAYIKKNSKQVPHINNLDTIKQDGFYRSIYLEEKPISGGLCETITLYFKEPIEVNELDIKPINCDIENIKFVYINGIEETISNLNSIELESRIITHIKFDIVCKNYNIIQYLLDKNKITDTTFEDIKAFEYSDKSTYEYILKRIEYNSANKTKSSTVYVNNINSYETQSISMYSYSFGLDNIDTNRVVLYSDNYFISEPINIGSLKDNEYIQLYVEDNESVNSSIEYYIVDGDIDIPIMPLNKTNYINNERIFPETETRFNISDNIENYNSSIIKKDSMSTSISLLEAKNLYDARYSISYIPVPVNTYKPLNNTIKIKAIIRTFNDIYDSIPYITFINIRKFGGNSLWTNLY